MSGAEVEGAWVGCGCGAWVGCGCGAWVGCGCPPGWPQFFTPLLILINFIFIFFLGILCVLKPNMASIINYIFLIGSNDFHGIIACFCVTFFC